MRKGGRCCGDKVRGVNGSMGWNSGLFSSGVLVRSHTHTQHHLMHTQELGERPDPEPNNWDHLSSFHLIQRPVCKQVTMSPDHQTPAAALRDKGRERGVTTVVVVVVEMVVRGNLRGSVFVSRPFFPLLSSPSMYLPLLANRPHVNILCGMWQGGC